MVSINLIIKPGRRAPEESSPTHFQARFPAPSPKIKDHDGLILQLETFHMVSSMFCLHQITFIPSLL